VQAATFAAHSTICPQKTKDQFNVADFSIDFTYVTNLKNLGSWDDAEKPSLFILAEISH
jgi:hypothetical protein